ncbi:hypothetical protein U8527_14615 [Kordia algicida OT-1]|uniref:Uncharacterized protein n=1 Tax=Kordia algicida OT-1 TaxID=391587 RepID=A9DYJ4_9FLAO|nr:hypothetical protein [Kordia algicida]EDP96140.1 hypothetical protein KAOT1_08223 [Kordia algicida OT-1]
MILTDNHLERLQKNQILDIAKFVVKENFKHHANNILPSDYEKDVAYIKNEEQKFYKDSEIYAAKDRMGSILGAIRVLKWNYKDKLPLEKIFGINPLMATQKTKINSIFHIGRFAIKKNVRNVNLFKKLMVCAIKPICQHKDNIAFAEIDSKLLRVLSLLGIKTEIIGKSINYLGSETIPISMTYEGLIDFYNKNKVLVASETFNKPLQTQQLPLSVVLHNKSLNYSFV